jgi:uncharacterized protein with von Willebrand factor type A (vWA) domain
MLNHYIYGRWDGTQQLFPFDAEELMEALSDELIADGDLMRALQRMMRNGDQGRLDNRMPGLQQLLDRLKDQRRQQLSQHDLNSIMDDILQKLEEIKEREQHGIAQRLAESRQRLDEARGDEGEQGEGQDQEGQQSPQGQREQRGQPGEQGQSTAGQADSQEGGDLDPEMRENLHRMLEERAKRKQEFLDRLPQDPAGQIDKLRDYDFMDAEAREKFQELLAMLEQQVMQSFFQGMQQGLQQMTPQDLDGIRDMVRDLNEMLEQKALGQEPDFQQFMDKHGQFFPGVENLDQLMEQMQRQQSAMQSLLDSMSPEQRQQLQGMMDQLLQDDRLRWDLAQLAQNLNRLMPVESESYPFRGDEPLSLQEAMRVMQNLQGLDELEQQFRQAQFGGLENIDPAAVEELLGPESAEDVRRLQSLTKLLEDAGYVEKRGKRFEITPRGMRKIGQKALTDIFSHLKKDRAGNHSADRWGGGTDRTDDTKDYEYGDPFLLDLKGTLMNSVRREGIGSPLKLQAADFEVYRTELLTQTATVLMVDMSRSMLLRGCFFAAKKVALALDSLIRGQFPRDSLYIIGFSYQARELKPDALPQLVWDEYEYGTNMQHGFMLARQLLARDKSANKQIIMITDGEPTAHWEGTRVAFNYPPTYRTIQETLKEVVRCTKEDIVINTFMLERGYYLADFINQVTQINHGRAFFAEPEQLGEYVLVDYVDKKRRVKRIH